MFRLRPRHLVNASDWDSSLRIDILASRSCFQKIPSPKLYITRYCHSNPCRPGSRSYIPMLELLRSLLVKPTHPRTAYHNDIFIGNTPRICHLYPLATSSDAGYSCSPTRGKICEMPFLSWRLKLKTVNRLVDSCRRVGATAPDLEILSHLIVRLFIRMVDFVDLGVAASLGKSSEPIPPGKLHAEQRRSHSWKILSQRLTKHPRKMTYCI